MKKDQEGLDKDIEPTLDIFIPQFLLQGDSSALSLLQSTALINSLMTDLPKQGYYQQLLLATLNDENLISKGEEERQIARKELHDLFLIIYARTEDKNKPAFNERIARLSHWIETTINQETLEDIKSNVITLQDFLADIQSQASTLLAKEPPVGDRNLPEDKSYFANKKDPQIFGNLFKDPQRFGSFISRAQDGFSGVSLFEYYRKKGGVNTFFKKTPTRYESKPLPYAQYLLAYFEVVMGNIFNLYVTVPKTRMVRMEGAQVLSKKSLAGVSLAQVPPKSLKKIPLENLFASIIISILLKEGDLKSQNMVTDFNTCSRIDFLYLLAQEVTDFENINLFEPLYLLKMLYKKMPIPKVLIDKVMENYDECVFDIITAIQCFAGCNKEQNLLEKTRLAIKLQCLSQLSLDELQKLGFRETLPSDLRKITEEQYNQLIAITPHALEEMSQEIEELERPFYLNFQRFLVDIDKMLNFISTEITSSKQNAVRLLEIWQQLGHTDKERIDVISNYTSQNKLGL